MSTTRPAAYPLITHDPYLSLWSFSDSLPGQQLRHWTGSPQHLEIVATIDGVRYCLAGNAADVQEARQVSFFMDSLSTIYVLEAADVSFTLRFTSPLLLEDLDVLSRPLSYLAMESESTDGRTHQVKVEVSISDSFCLDKPGSEEVTFAVYDNPGFASASMGSRTQKMLTRAGDDLRIEWGEVYLSVEGRQAGIETSPRHQVQLTEDESADRDRDWKAKEWQPQELSWLTARADLSGSKGDAIFSVAYDDHRGLSWFGVPLKSYWQKDGSTIQDVILTAHADYENVIEACDSFAADLYEEALDAGGEAYAELCVMAYRQSVAAHKLALSPEGEIFFVSKENFSNGCAVTVDISYPSVPLYLHYNPELVAGMLRPILQYASMDRWPWPFAPHDVGTYPLLHGQVYGGQDGAELRNQMPIEECGNMLIMTAAYTRASKDRKLAKDYAGLLLQWTDYLVDHGRDPGDQLCTDDFAGHLAHNVNLSAKALMGIASMGIICEAIARRAPLRHRLAWYDAGKDFLIAARDLAADWRHRAVNADGSYRLAFDRPGSWSLKYNLIWDSVFGTNLFRPETLKAETQSYLTRLNRYGVPLDERSTYTKSDWQIWAACLLTVSDEAAGDEGFETICEAMTDFYNETEDRVPMTDWYDSVSGRQQGFQARSVQGGIFMKVLLDADSLS